MSSILESLSVEEVCARSGTKPAAFYELDKRITRLQLEARDADNAAKAAQTRVRRCLAGRAGCVIFVLLGVIIHAITGRHAQVSVRAGVCTKVERAAKRLQAKVLELCQRGGLPVPEELAQLMLQVCTTLRRMAHCKRATLRLFSLCIVHDATATACPGPAHATGGVTHDQEAA